MITELQLAYDFVVEALNQNPSEEDRDELTIIKISLYQLILKHGTVTSNPK